MLEIWNKTSCLYLCHVGIYLGNNWNNNDAIWYLSVRGWGRQRLPREGRSKVSGFLSNLHAWMFRNLNMWTLPLRHIWKTETQQVRSDKRTLFNQAGLNSCIHWVALLHHVKTWGAAPKLKEHITPQEKPWKQWWANTTGHVLMMWTSFNRFMWWMNLPERAVTA